MTGGCGGSSVCRRLKRHRTHSAHRCRTGRARATGRVCRWRSRLDEVTYRAQVPSVYHLCAEDFRGTTIYPLHRLRDEHPDIYELERPKWDGRESVLNFGVPHLGVTWGDTVNLAALDPVHLVAARRRLGVAYSRLLERRVVRIPVERLAGRDAVIYESRSHWLNSRPGQDVPATPPEEDFTRFDVSSYEELTEVPQLHLDYLAQQKEAGEPALGFVFVRHVLVAGPVDISGLTPTRL